MHWGTGRGTRQGDPASHRSRRLIVAVTLALASAVGTAALDSAIKSHVGAEPVDLVAASAAYSAHATAVTSSAPRIVKTSPPPATTVPRTTPTTAAPVTTTSIAPHHAPAHAAATPSTTAAAEKQAVASALQTRSTIPATPALASGDSCSAAIAYLSAHAAPGFQFECPGYALGHQAMTCINVAGVCPGAKLIVISAVCPASYMNEAHNSWVLSGLASGSIDPYGYCH